MRSAFLLVLAVFSFDLCVQASTEMKKENLSFVTELDDDNIEIPVQAIDGDILMTSIQQEKNLSPEIFHNTSAVQHTAKEIRPTSHGWFVQIFLDECVFRI